MRGAPFFGPSRVILASFALASLLADAGCKKKEAPPEAKKEAVAPETAVPAPDGMVAEGIMKSPDAIMASLRTISPIIPDKAAPILADVLHVNRVVADEIDGQRPAFFVMARKGETSLYVFAAPIKDASKVGAELVKLGMSRMEDNTLGLSVFEGGATPGGPRTQVLGIRRNFLLAATSVQALKDLAPYATRSLPLKPVPTQEIAVTVPQSAVRGALRDAFKGMIDAGTAKRKELLAKAKSAPQKTPVGLMDAVGDYATRQNERMLGWLADAGDAHVTLSTTGGSVTLKADVAAVVPDSVFGKTIASWPLGDSGPALDVPIGAVLAFVGRSGEVQRTESSRDLLEMLVGTFPDDIQSKEKEKIAEFLAAWDKARADLTSGALLYEGPSRLGVGLRIGAKDPAALAKLLETALTSVLGMKGVTAGLEKQGIGKPTLSKEKIGGIEANVLSLKLPHPNGEKPKPGEPETAEIVWAQNGTTVDLAAGVGARELFQRVVEAKAEKSLRTYPEVVKRLEALGNELGGALLGVPSRVVPLSTGSPVVAPTPPGDLVVLAMGKNAQGPFVSLDLSRGAVEVFGRLAMQTMAKK
ncbi:MAG: hypothetical protein JNL79_34900 [Myxococcales bacterium]|nr:hypothetical protein [Myxococcales bacterium]